MKQDAKLARRIYTALLYLYPVEFRHAYAYELILLFVDMYRAAASQGRRAVVSLWLSILLDLSVTATRERIRMMFTPERSAMTSLIFFFPLLFLYSIALLPFEPSFLGPLLDFLFPPDQHLFEIYLMLSTPIAFLINLLPMLRKSNFEQTRPFHTARSHTVTGFSILIVLLIIFSPLVFDYLDGIVPRSIQVLYLLALLPLPTAFLLGRLPRSIKVDSKSTLVFRPTPINLLIGAALLLVILMELSSFVLERFACSYWGSC